MYVRVHTQDISYDNEGEVVYQGSACLSPAVMLNAI